MRDRTVSTANSGMPWAWASIAAAASGGSWATSPASSSRISASANGLKRDEGPVPAGAQAGRRSTSSGRAKPKTSTGRSRTQSTRCSRKSSRPSSASCRSSTSSSTGWRRASPRRSAASRRTARPGPAPRRSSGRPSRGASRAATKARSVSSSNRAASERGELRLDRARSSSSPTPRRARTISVSAQNAVSSPKRGHGRGASRRSRRARRRTSPAPSPAATCRPRPGPDDQHQARRVAGRSRAAASFRGRTRRSRPTKGASRPSTRWAPPMPETTSRACHSVSGSALPLSSTSPCSVELDGQPRQPRVVVSTSTVPGAAADCTRAAVLTASPATMPGPRRPGWPPPCRSPRLPVRRGPGAPIAAPRSRNLGDQVQRRPDGALGVALDRDRECPRPPSPRRR